MQQWGKRAALCWQQTNRRASERIIENDSSGKETDRERTHTHQNENNRAEYLHCDQRAININSNEFIHFLINNAYLFPLPVVVALFGIINLCLSAVCCLAALALRVNAYIQPIFIYKFRISIDNENNFSLDRKNKALIKCQGCRVKSAVNNGAISLRVVL
jgi:hypothetical protein